MLTTREDQTLSVLIAAQKRGEPQPTYEDIRVRLGLRSRSGICRLIDSLCAKGYLEKRGRHYRGLYILKDPSGKNMDNGPGSTVYVRGLEERIKYLESRVASLTHRVDRYHG